MKQLQQVLSLLSEVSREATPPTDLAVDEWADTYRRLSPEASAEPGAWKTSRAEYQRGIFQALTEANVHTVVVMSSSQVGKTEIINNTIGYFVHQDPSPILLVNPTLEMAAAWSKDRFAPMIRDTPALSHRVQEAGAKKTGNTMLHKSFPGGHLTAAGANSAAGLAARPVRVLLCDEVDRYPPSAGTEGDPVLLAKKRTRTFWNRKILITSTPTVKGVSRIEAEFEESDQRFFYIPCSQCGHFQVLRWRNVVWPEGKPEEAQYACEECGGMMSDAQRLKQIPKGEWRASQPFNSRAGFHLNEIYSPWSSMGEMAVAFLEAKKSPDTLQTFVNTALGETWEDEGETVDETGLLARREQYEQAPDGVLVLTAGVDVQADRVEYEVVGWGHGEQSWGIETGQIRGDPSLQDVWSRLDEVLGRTFERVDGAVLSIACAGVDSGGHHTQIVYDYCGQRQHRRVYALKGIAGPGKPTVQTSKAKNKRLILVGVDDAKGTLYSRLKISEPGPGYCHFPTSYVEEYFLQLTGEKLVTKFSKGFPRREWQKTRARNEALDMRVYAYAALKLLNPQWAAIERKLLPEESPEAEETPRRQTQRNRRPMRRKSWATDI